MDSLVTARCTFAGVLLRDPEQPGPRVPAGQGGVRRRHRRAGHAVRGELQGLHAHHAAAARQPHALDLRHAGRRRRYPRTHTLSHTHSHVSEPIFLVQYSLVIAFKAQLHETKQLFC